MKKQLFLFTLISIGGSFFTVSGMQNKSSKNYEFRKEVFPYVLSGSGRHNLPTVPLTTSSNSLAPEEEFLRLPHQGSPRQEVCNTTPYTLSWKSINFAVLNNPCSPQKKLNLDDLRRSQ